MRRILATGLLLGLCASALVPQCPALAQDDTGPANTSSSNVYSPDPYQPPPDPGMPAQPVPTQPTPIQVTPYQYDRGQVARQSSVPTVNEGASGGNPLLPQLLERVQTLEDQVRTLRGRVDELQNGVQHSQQDLSKQIGDMQFQLQQGGQAAGQANTTPTVTPPAPDQNGGVVRSPPPRNLSPTDRRSSTQPDTAAPSRVAIQDANDALRRGDYRAAETAAQAMARSGKHGYDAQFIVAQAKAGQHDYKDAAIAYDDLYNHNKHGRWAQDGLLGVAASLYNLGDNKAACGALRRLQSEFPTQRTDVRKNATALQGRAGC